MRLLLSLSLLLLAACQTTNKQAALPTSERLTDVKTQKLTSLEQDLITQDLALGQPLYIRIFKEEKYLETWLKDPETKIFEPFKRYPICKYSGNLGPKLKEGDKQAPEGFYKFGAEQMNPWSEFHLSFNIGYPNEYDRAHGRTGSNIMVHGDCKSVGCFAITDGYMEEVYLLAEASIANGHDVPVHIFPFKMTDINMARHSGSGWIYFWENLKQGHDAFELTRIPPEARPEAYKYAFTNHDSILALY